MRLPFCLLLLAAASFSAKADNIRVTDDSGRVFESRSAPQRVVSLLPSLTESVCALGACKRLVGVDNYSNYPAQVRALPKLGGLDDVNIEAIVALKPDVVLAAPSSRVGDRLRALGVAVVTLDAKSYIDVRRVLYKLGDLLAISGVDKFWGQIEKRVVAAAQSMPARTLGLRVYFEIGSGPYAAGSTSYMGELLDRLGARNIIPDNLGPFPKISPEYVVRANPQVILIAESDAAGLADRPGWNKIEAISKQHVCKFTADQRDMLARPGPRMPEAAQLMADCLTTNSR